MLTVDHLLLVLTGLSALYWLGALVCVVTFGRRRVITLGWTPPISVLKPLLRNDGRLYENLRSVCQQDYPRYQVLFGVQDEHDEAIPVVERLIREFPHRDLRIIVNSRTIGRNRKISNVANLCQEAQHDILVLADSDMRVGRDYLRSVVAPLHDESVGLVTCLYRSRPQPGLGAALASMFINEWFVPAVLVGARLQPLRHAFGATIACRRRSLAAIGGFEAVADYLADDYMLGSLMSERGLRVVLSGYLVENAGADRDVPGLFFRELRWTRTFRIVRPLSYFLSGITHGIPLSLLFLLTSGFSDLALGLAAVHLGLRAAGGIVVYRTLGLPVPRGRLWLLPLRDSLSFLTWLLSFLGHNVRWNGRRLRVDASGKLHPLPEAAASPPHPSTSPQGMKGQFMPDTAGAYLRTLFLHPPSYQGFDGGAGARYQARREIRSFWYPTWLAQPAALVPGSRLVDAPPDGVTVEEVVRLARQYELAILHTSTPSFAHDVTVANALKAENPSLRIGFVGAQVAVDPVGALRASDAIEFVAGNEFDFTIRDVAQGLSLSRIPGLSYREHGRVRHTPPRPILEDMDALPFVVEVYKRDLTIDNYAIGYLLHPFVSLYTGRGCRSRCTFCLWPQTVGGQRYRTRSVDHVVREIALATTYFPGVKEYFFDDDTFTDDLPRAEAIARGLGKLGVTWSCNAKANVPYPTLKILKDNGLRLLLVGYESGNQEILNNIKKGIRLDVARRFTADAKRLGIKIHGTFILGLPGETPETIQRTIQFARDLDPHTLQVSMAAPYPGTALHRQALEHGWIVKDALVDEAGLQASVLSYPHLSSPEIFHATEEFYRRFYFRPRKIFALAGEMMTSPQVLRRRLREGVEFLRFLTTHRKDPGRAT